MKIFIYKVIVTAFIFVIVFEITIGNQIKKANQKFDYYLSSEAIENFKIKLKSEIAKANKKENLLDPDEKILIRGFINKIKKEISAPNN